VELSFFFFVFCHLPWDGEMSAMNRGEERAFRLSAIMQAQLVDAINIFAFSI
jgi:hypothetical protein